MNHRLSFCLVCLLTGLLPHAARAVNLNTDPTLILWLKLDETTGTSVTDSSASNLTATLAGGGTWTSPGRLGDAIELNNYVGQHTGQGGATVIKIAAHRCNIETMLVDGTTGVDNKGIEVAGAVKGFWGRFRVRGFQDDGDCLMSTNSADVEALDVEFRGDFEDVTTTGSETVGLGQLFDLDDGWTGSITLINTTDGSVSDIAEGAAL